MGTASRVSKPGKVRTYDLGGKASLNATLVVPSPAAISKT